MSRSGYGEGDIDDLEGLLAHGRWQAIIRSATRGKRGQRFFRDLLAALDAMPEKRLIANNFVAEGEYCTLGVLAASRGVDLKDLDSEDDDVGEDIGPRLNIAQQLARHVMYENDEGTWDSERGLEAPERRWTRMRKWVEEQIKEPKP